MAKKVNVIGAQPKRIRVLDKPRRRIEPGELASRLGARMVGHYLGSNLDPISIAELATRLMQRLRSSGGRPALSDATEFCRVPLSPDDLRALETLTDQIERDTGARPSPGQVASVILRDYLTSGARKSQPTPIPLRNKGAWPEESNGNRDE